MTLDDVIAKVTDPYERQARLYPALLTFLPLLVVVTVFYGKDGSPLSIAASVAVSCGGLYLLGNVSREFGKRLEGRLFKEWGGKPSTQMLRHRDKTIDSVTKRRYHTFLARKINHSFPDQGQEAADPGAADDIYQSGVRWLLDHTRPDDTKRFDLLLKENVSYGFRRNALGMKPLGLLVAAGAAAWALVASGALFGQSGAHLDMNGLAKMTAPAWACLAFSAAMISTWLLFITRTTVRTSAFTYAEMLLRACETLDVAAKP